MVAKNVSLQSTTDGRHQTDPLFCTTVGWEGGGNKCCLVAVRKH